MDNSRPQRHRWSPMYGIIFSQIRDRYIQKGIFKPANRWRKSTQAKSTGRMDYRQRAINLSQRLPNLVQFNFTRQ